MRDDDGFTVPGPLEVIAALPRLGLNLVLPAMVMGAVWMSLLDILLGHEGYPLAKAGVVIGPLIFAWGLNVLERIEWAREAERAAFDRKWADRQAAEKTLRLDDYRAGQTGRGRRDRMNIARQGADEERKC